MHNLFNTAVFDTLYEYWFPNIQMHCLTFDKTFFFFDNRKNVMRTLDNPWLPAHSIGTVQLKILRRNVTYNWVFTPQTMRHIRVGGSLTPTENKITKILYFFSISFIYLRVEF